MRQLNKKTSRRAPAQAPAPAQDPPPGARKPVNVTRGGIGTSKRTHSNQPLDQRVKTVQEVFADSARTQINATNETIKALRVLRQPEVTGPSSNDVPAQREQTAPPTDPVHRESDALTSDVPAQGGSSTEPMSTTEYLVDQVFTGPIISGRHWTCEFVKTRRHSSEQRVDFWLVENTGQQQRRWFGDADLDLSFASRISLDIANAANRFTGRVEDMSKDFQAKPMVSTAKFILEAAKDRQQTGRWTMTAPILVVVNKKDRSAYDIRFRIHCFDPKTFQKYVFISTCTIIQTARISPPYIPNVRFLAGADKRPLSVHQVNNRDVHESLVPAEIPDSTVANPWKEKTKRQALLQAEQVARAIVATFDGRIISADALKIQVKQCSQSFGSAFSHPKAPKAPKPYGGFKLFSYDRAVSQRVTRIKPSPAVERDIDPTSGRLPTITVKSINRARLVPVVEALHQTWLLTGDILEAWLACAEAAYAANQAIENDVPAQELCHRSGSDPSCCQSHVCGSCASSFSCRTMLDGNLGLRVCSRCDVKDRRRFPLGLSFTVVREKLTASIRKDCKKAGIEWSDERANTVLKQAHQDLEKWFEGAQHDDTYVDGYSDIVRVSAGEKPSGLFKNDAFGISIDAAFPYRDAGLHVKGNLVTCPLAVNLAKATHLPA